jgi:hypothetical protein
VTVAEPSPGVTLSPVAAGAALPPPPQATKAARVNSAAMNNLSERKNINKSNSGIAGFDGNRKGNYQGATSLARCISVKLR